MSQYSSYPSGSKSYVQWAPDSAYDRSYICSQYYQLLIVLTEIKSNEEKMDSDSDSYICYLDAYINDLWNEAFWHCCAMAKEFEKPAFQQAFGTHENEEWKENLKATMNEMKAMAPSPYPFYSFYTNPPPKTLQP